MIQPKTPPPKGTPEKSPPPKRPKTEGSATDSEAPHARKKSGRGGKREGAGRKSMWTPDIEKLFFQSVAAGSSLKDACKFAGFDFETLTRWRVKDEAFGKRVEGALLAVKIGLLARMSKHSERHHSATAWLLERRWPDEFGRQRVELTGADAGPIRIETDVDADLATLLRSSKSGHDEIWKQIDKVNAAAAAAGARKRIR